MKIALEIRKIFQIARRDKYFLFALSLLTFPLAYLKSYQVYLIKPIFDKGFSASSSPSDIHKVILLLFLSVLISYPLRLAYYYFTRFPEEKISCNLRSILMHEVLSIDMIFFSTLNFGDLLSRLNADVILYCKAIRNIFVVFKEVLTVLAYLALAFYHDVYLSIVCLSAFPVYFFIFKKIAKTLERTNYQILTAMGEMASELNYSITGNRLIKTYNAQNFFNRRFQDKQSRYLGKRKKFTLVSENAKPMVETIGIVLFCGVLILGHQQIATSKMTVGSFMSFLSAIALLVDPIRRMNSAFIEINSSIAAGKRVNEVLNYKKESLKGLVVENLSSDIELKNISYSYGEKEVLKGINLVIPRGRKVALVGSSGAGKTTLVDLLLGFLAPTQGEVIINGKDLKDISKESWRKQITYISQKVFLYNMSVRDNIICEADLDEKKMRWACKVAYAEEVINKLPNSFDTQINDQATNLSGGERQRIALARGFYRDSEIYILDEATSALDNDSDRAIQNNLREHLKGKTIITIAHKLDTIVDYDHIFFLKDGKLVEQGNHQELLDMKGEYFHLYMLKKGVN